MTLDRADAEWVGSYAAETVDAFTTAFRDAARLPEWQRLVARFTQAVTSVFTNGFSSFPAVNEAHNELCIAKALLENNNPLFDQIAYEPRLEGCLQSIDFRATGPDGLTVYVDVKTIQPRFLDRWDQYETAIGKQWFPDNVNVVLSKAWLGGELWHAQVAARSRMLEYAVELERKISEAGLAVRENTFSILALCGAGYHWHEDELEDFVAFYDTGRHRGDDPMAKMEIDHMIRKRITLNRTIERFACMKRAHGNIFHSRLNWKVQPPRDLPF